MRGVLSRIAGKCLSSLPAPMQSVLLRELLAVTSREWQFRNGQLTMFGSIANLQSNGLAPRSVLDIGAHNGAWTRKAAKIFADARFLMIEARPVQKPKLEAVVAALNGRAAASIALLGSEAKESVPFYSLGTGSSVFEEATTFGRRAVSLPMRTLDGMIEERKMQSPFFVKLDVQGYELEVLKGGAVTLAKSDAVLMEVSFLEYNRGAPLINEVFDFMRRADFVPYDVCSLQRRMSDGALFQTDIIFTRRDSIARATKKFWNHEP